MFGVRLDDLGVTGQEIADRSGVSPKAVSDWQLRISDPLLSYAFDVAAAFGYDVDDLTAEVPLPAPRRDPIRQQPKPRLLKATCRTDFAVALTALLERERLSPKACGDLLGVHSTTVWHWQRADTEPKLYFANALAIHFNLRLHAMCEGLLEPARGQR